MDMIEAIERFEAEEKIVTNEGRRGVEGLCRLVHALGYEDPMRQGQFEKGCIGDLIEFLKDNPGCVEAIKEWIAEQDVPEWADSLESYIPEDEDEE